MPRLFPSVAAVVVASLVAGACATSLQVTIEPAPGEEAAPATSTSPQAANPPASQAPTPTATPRPPATPLPELAYDDAIAAYFADVERFWAGAAPSLDFDFVPVAERIPYDPADEIPSCGGDTGPEEIYEGNAFYCSPDDYIAWDDVNLFPDLYDVYGAFTVGLVIAHEYAHAMQEQAQLRGRTILVELQADCFAGAWAGSVQAGESEGIPFDRSHLDDAIGGFLTFADPLGTPAGDPAAHGTAFDRLNAFAEGFQQGVGICERFLTDPPQTASLLVDQFDQNLGDLPLERLIPLLVVDLERFHDRLGDEMVGPSFTAPFAFVEFGGPLGPPPPCGSAAVDPAQLEGSAYYCGADDVVYADRAELDQLWSDVGDFAPSYSIAHAYAMSVASRLVSDPGAAVLGADCLVGVWARDVFDEAAAPPLEPLHEISLSAGDLDEGIVGLLLVPPLGPSLTDPGDVATFDRVAAFGAGFFRGRTACALN